MDVVVIYFSFCLLCPCVVYSLELYSFFSFDGLLLFFCVLARYGKMRWASFELLFIVVSVLLESNASVKLVTLPKLENKLTI